MTTYIYTQTHIYIYRHIDIYISTVYVFLLIVPKVSETAWLTCTIRAAQIDLYFKYIIASLMRACVSLCQNESQCDKLKLVLAVFNFTT